MTKPQGLDELIWSKEYEDTHDWVECLTMVIDMKVSNQKKLFKIAKLNWWSKQSIGWSGWTLPLQIGLNQKVQPFSKFGAMDENDIWVNMDSI